MKLKSIVAAAAIAVAGGSAFAGSASFSSGVAEFDNDPFTATGSFTQTISFAGLMAGVYDILGDISGTGLTFSSVKLDGVLWDLYADNKGKARFGSFEVLGGSAPSILTVIGTVTNANFSRADYSGSLQVTAVPEPGTYALLFAGLGVIGFVARRRLPQQ